MQKVHRTHQRIVIQLPKTDVAVLCKAHFHDLGCQELWFQTGVKDRMRFIPPLFSLLGQLLCKAFPAFHALTSCDLPCKELAKRLPGRPFWKKIGCNSNCPKLVETQSLTSESTLRSGEEPLCTSDSPKECFAKAHDVCNYLFCLKNNKSEELPPTVESFGHHITQANYQTCLETSHFVYAHSNIAWWKWLETRGRQIGFCVNVKVQRAKDHRAKDMPLQPVSMCLELFLWSEQPFLPRSMYVYGRWKLLQSMEWASHLHFGGFKCLKMRTVTSLSNLLSLFL